MLFVVTATTTTTTTTIIEKNGFKVFYLASLMVYRYISGIALIVHIFMR